MGRPDSREVVEPAAGASNPDVFDDEFAVTTPERSEFEFPIADGFRPGYSGSRDSVRAREETTRRLSLLDHTADSRPRSPVRTISGRSSISKNRADILRRPDERTRGALPRTTQVRGSTSTFESVRRSMSLASSFAPHTDSSEIQALDGGGPSYPYAMYSQTGIRRSMSTRTDITDERPQSEYDPLGRPTHPYALYTQNSLPAMEQDVPAPRTIRLGIPALNVGFQRQIGPDGEEQGIVGPDGHTEQLPPYSQYPDENEKAYAALAAHAPLSPTRSLSGDALVSSAQPLPHDSISEVSTQIASSTEQSSTSNSEKRWREKNWKERRKTKVCCGKIPLCWVFVAGGFIGFISLVLIGGIIGALVAKERREAPAMITVTSTKSLLGASPIPTPSEAPPLPIGVFYLPLGPPVETQKDCIASAFQMDAWACNLEPPSLAIDIQHVQGQLPQARISSLLENANMIQYGPQAPFLDSQNLTYVIDEQNPSYGPALHFQTTYNKLVVLPPNALSKTKRHQPDHSQQDWPHEYPPQAGGGASPSSGDSLLPPGGMYSHRRNTVQPGDQPWFCYWNRTFIEGFIYMKQPISTTVRPSGSSPSPTASTTPTSGASSSIATTAIGNPSATPSTVAARRGEPHSVFTQHDNIGPHSALPYLAKLSEARLPRANSPVHAYCQQMTVAADGSVAPSLAANGQPIVLNIDEQDPSSSQFEGAFNPTSDAADGGGGGASSRRRSRRSTDMCSCQWLAQ